MNFSLSWRLLFVRGRMTTLLAGVAVGGVTLGVLVLTTVLAVMNGFETMLSHKLVALGAAVTVTSPTTTSNWQGLAARLEHAPGVVAAAPRLNGEALLMHHGGLAAVAVSGIDPDAEARATDLGQRLTSGRLAALGAGHHQLVVGKALADTLHLKTGDELTVLTARSGSTASSFTPALQRYRVAGIYQLGIYQVEQHQVYTDLADARALFPNAGTPTLALRLRNPLAASAAAAQLRTQLGPRYVVTDWTERQANLFATIGLEKRMLFIVLAAILAVAAFTVVATLIVAGLDREADIAILKTLGLTPRRIAAVFMTQGLLLGIVGAVLGLGLGAALAMNVNHLLGGLDHLFHTQLLPPSVYLISELPAHFRWQDMTATAGVALLLCLLAAVYPALRGARLPPAEALRHE
ncbi:MAG: ABC transporter permease [Terriglobales bacterium]